MSLAKKLRIKESTTITVVNGPSNYEEILGELPGGCKINYALTGKHEFIQVFVKNKAELDASLPLVVPALAPKGILWICYPKGSSKIQTDLTRDKGWDELSKLNLAWINLISFDDTWSCFGLKNEVQKAPTKAAEDLKALQAQWADPVAKTVKVPEDLLQALSENPAALSKYNSYSYSHRKEWVMHVVSAKTEATRLRRVEGVVKGLLGEA